MNWYRKAIRHTTAMYKQALPTGYIQCKNPKCRKEFIVDFDPMPAVQTADDAGAQAYLDARKPENNKFKKFDPEKQTEHGTGVFRCAYCGQPFNSTYDFHPAANPSNPLDVEYEPISPPQFESLIQSGLPQFAAF